MLIELHPDAVHGIGREVSGLFERIAGRPYQLFDWHRIEDGFLKSTQMRR